MPPAQDHKQQKQTTDTRTANGSSANHQQSNNSKSATTASRKFEAKNKSDSKSDAKTESTTKLDLKAKSNSESKAEAKQDEIAKLEQQGAHKVCNGHPNGLIDEDIDDERPTPPSSKQQTNKLSEKALNGPKSTPDMITSETVRINGDEESEFIYVHEDAFNIKISAPGIETFEIPASTMEAVQEIHHLLMDREETCSRTCFSLVYEGQRLDRFAELKSVPNLKEGSVLKVVEDPYTVREARIHLRHIRDLLRSLDQSDAYNGLECRSLTFLNTFGDIIDIKKQKTATLDCTPPAYIVPDANGQLSVNEPQLKCISNLDSFDRKNSLQALKVVSTSGWNPPPGPRKLHGDLLYLLVVTMEDRRFHITCCTKGFFVNQSTDDTFNPAASTTLSLVCHSLVDLLNHLSPAFKRNFVQIQKRRREKHPFERVATPYQVYTWTAPQMDHCIDTIRAEDASSSKLGYEEHLPGQTRDWNEELQTIRKLPRKTLPQRLIRERAMFKVHSDFVAAATRGAMAVIDGNVMAINPGVDKRLQMFIWHGIFFSLGFDVSDHYSKLGGDYAAHYAPSLDLQGVMAYNTVDSEELYTVGTVVIDYRGYRVVAQTIIPGIMDREQEESVVYGSVDFGQTVVANPKYVELLSNCAKQLRIAQHRVLNEKDEEVELCSSVESKGIIGNDGRYYILDLLHTFSPDVNYLGECEQNVRPEVKAAGFPKVFKHKLCCLRQELLDEFHRERNVQYLIWAPKKLLPQFDGEDLSTASNEKFEEIAKKLEQIAEEFIYSSDIGEEISSTANNNSISKKSDDSKTASTKLVFELIQKIALKTKFDVAFNPDAYSPQVRHAPSEQLDKQRQLIRNAADFLLLEQLPRFVTDCAEGAITIWDGFTLSSKLHDRGINIRYLGRLAELVKEHKQLGYLNSIIVTELLCRSAKHVFNRYLQTVDSAVNLASAIALFLNCLLSTCDNVNPLDSRTSGSSQHSSNFVNGLNKRLKKKKKAASTSAQQTGSNNSISTNGVATNSVVIQTSSYLSDFPEWIHFTSGLLFGLICDDLTTHYSFKASATSITELIQQNELHKICILRNFCIKVGLQISQRDYVFNDVMKPTFDEQDVHNIFPVVKHAHPPANDAFQFFNTGLVKLQQADLKSASELLCEALNLMNNVYGAMHPEIVLCLRAMARIYYLHGQYKEAVSSQQKALLMCEKVHGIDSALCVPEYVFLALYSFANRQCTDTLHCLYRAKYLLLLTAGSQHPEHGTLDANIGIVLHTLSEHEVSLRFLRSAINFFEKQPGQKSIKVAICHHLASVACSALGECRDALQCEIEAYRLYKHLLGENHEKTRESSSYLKVLTNQAVQAQKRLNGSGTPVQITSTTNTTASEGTARPSSSGIEHKMDPLQLSSADYDYFVQILGLVNGMHLIQLSALDVAAFRASLFGSSQEVDLDALRVD